MISSRNKLNLIFFFFFNFSNRFYKTENGYTNVYVLIELIFFNIYHSLNPHGKFNLGFVITDDNEKLLAEFLQFFIAFD